MSKTCTDSGKGVFHKALSDKYVIFEYSTLSGSEAKSIFTFNKKADIYRYWWFENSGNFLSATCNFISDDCLAMNWHDSLLVQTFMRESADRIVLKMKYPATKGDHKPVLEVIFRRK